MNIKGKIRNYLKKLQTRISKNHFNKPLLDEIFENIYDNSSWGRSTNPLQPFYSGSGSHDVEIVLPYIQAVEFFLNEFEKKPNVVDLGCGDFSIGSKLRYLCNNYIASDIVAKLIDFNKTKYANLNVDFRVSDLTKDELPKADIVFIRQVLQHLSNEHILNALPELCTKFQFIVLTEHLPNISIFEPNIDIPSGSGRLHLKSGIVLTSPPFNINPVMQKKICEVPEMGGLIVTTVYQLHL